MAANESNACEIVFEVSNEIANKIGGIYTVVASKAPEMRKMLGTGNYITIGLYNSFKAKNDFEELDPPHEFEEAFANLRLEGIDVKYGRWIGGGSVETILVDPSHLLDVPLITGKAERRIDVIKGYLWENYQIDSLWMPEVFDPMVSFGWSAGMLIAQLLNCPRFKEKKIVAQFHEWISGPGLLYLKLNKIPIATAFMTHATQLGRNIAMGVEDINEVVDEYLAKGETIPPQKAYQYHVEGTHQLEVVCAREADILITVSEAVAREAECILARKPDFVIPNGINFDTISSKESLKEKHQNSRLVINRFIEAYFNPYYPIVTENLLVVHISGRYEFHNKGIDVFLEALKIVNDRLTENKSTLREVLAFIWVPAPVSGIRPSISKAIELARKQRNILHSPLFRIEDWLLSLSSSYKNQLKDKSLEEFFTESEIDEITTIMKEISKARDKKHANPPFCPFIINERDTIYQTLEKLNLMNNKNDKVKIIFYPTYLSRSDNLLELDYYDAVAGCDMGIYPSVYEPFGLTPLEALALGVPAVTTDLPGFGLLMDEEKCKQELGICVLKRRGLSIKKAADNLANIILKHSNLSSKQVSDARDIARDIAEKYSWQNIIVEYKKAFDKAIQKQL